MKKKEEIKEELDALSPFLSKLDKDKKEGFSMPANYFDKFETRLMHRIEQEEALERKEQLSDSVSIERGFFDFLRTLLRPKIAVGFSLTMVLVVFGLYLSNSSTIIEEEACSTLLACLTIEEINDYVITNIEDFKTEDIIETIPAKEIEVIREQIAIVKEQPIEQEVINDNNNKVSNIDQAIETAGVDDLLDDLTEEDLEDLEEEDIF